MALIDRNTAVHTFTTRRLDHALQKTFAWGTPIGVFTTRSPMVLKARSTARRVDSVAIVHHKAMSALAGHTRSKLLDRPLSRRMFGHIPVQQSAGPDVEHDKDVQESEPGRHRHEEIAGEHIARMIAHEGRPCLCPRPGMGRTRSAHVTSDRSCREREARRGPVTGRGPPRCPTAARRTLKALITSRASDHDRIVRSRPGTRVS